MDDVILANQYIYLAAGLAVFRNQSLDVTQFDLYPLIRYQNGYEYAVAIGSAK